MIDLVKSKISAKWVFGLWLIGFGLISALYPRDISYDVVHYQIHNGWAFFKDRYAIDFAPAEMHSFLNPIWQMFIWIMVDNLPGRIVAFILGSIQALILPVLYVLTKKILRAQNVSAPNAIIALIAVAGFLAEIQFTLFATVRNDAIGALAFLIAIALLLPRQFEKETGSTQTGFSSHKKQLILASFVLGCVMGMKLTNVVYVVGFAAMVLCIMPNWKDRIFAALICGIFGLIGIIVCGGFWFWHLWQSVGNPIFPMYNELFQSNLGPDYNFKDLRYMPEGFIDGLLRPFKFLFNGELINEYHFVDPRFQMVYIIAPVFIGLFVWRAMKKQTLKVSRALFSLSVGVMVSIVTWTFIFSIERYLAAVWILGPVFLACFLTIFWPKILTHEKSFLFGLVGVVLLNAFTQLGTLRRVPWNEGVNDRWDEPYLTIELPNTYDYQTSIVLFAGAYPTAFLASHFPETAIFSHVAAPKWSRPALEHYQPLIRKMIWEKEKHRPIYIVVYDSLSDIDKALSHVKKVDHLLGDISQCERIRTNFSYDNGAQWKVCPLRRAEQAPIISSR